MLPKFFKGMPVFVLLTRPRWLPWFEFEASSMLPNESLKRSGYDRFGVSEDLEEFPAVSLQVAEHRLTCAAIAYGKKTHGLKCPKGFRQALRAHAKFEHKLPLGQKPVAWPWFALKNGPPHLADDI
jgi:hypothetical protein